MTTLKATAAASQALERRKLQSWLQAVRSRAEALPQLNLGGLLAGAQNKLDLLRFADCAAMLDDIDDRIERHRPDLADAEMVAAGQAQEQLLAERGIETVDVGVAKSRDGWQWLTSRKPRRLSPDQISTGDRYSALYLGANRDTLSTVGANDNGLLDGKDPVEVLSDCRAKLGKVQRHIIDATGSERLVALLDAVCGRGETLRFLAGNDDRKANGYEVELRIALDMAGVAFKMGGKREGAA